MKEMPYGKTNLSDGAIVLLLCCNAGTGGVLMAFARRSLHCVRHWAMPDSLGPPLQGGGAGIALTSRRLELDCATYLTVVR
jgi:hypothetical protein